MPTLSQHERSPLLAPKQSPTPLPWFQFSILLFLQAAEPISSLVIYPFAPQLIRDVGVTHGDEKKVGYYVGILQSSFFVAQALTILNWSRLSDRIGRKPVLITGLFGISLSMCAFGLSTTFPTAVLSRCLNGAVNGNIGVMKSMMAEVTDSTNAAQAFAFFPIAWAAGSAVGPMIGGSLSKPTEQYPEIFGNIQLFKIYPYLLPCMMSASYTLLAMFVAWGLLKETVADPVPIRKLVYQKLQRLTRSASTSSKPVASLEMDTAKQLPLRSLLTYRVVISTLNYMMIAFIDIAYRGVMPIFYSTPPALGGLGFSPSAIGICLSVYGLLAGLFQAFCFTAIHRRLGGKNLMLFSVSLAFPMFALFPLMSIWTKHYGFVTKGVWVMIVLQLTLFLLYDMAFACIFIYIAAASPDIHSIGATNGIAQMSVSIIRAFSPSLTNSLYSLSMERNYLGGRLVWWVLLGITAMTVKAGTLVPKQVWKRPGEQ